jgi:hypothetical protein
MIQAAPITTQAVPMIREAPTAIQDHVDHVIVAAVDVTDHDGNSI